MKTLSEEFVRRIRATHADAEDFLRAIDTPPALSVRYNALKIGDMPEHAGRVAWCREGRYLSERPSFTCDPLLHAGAYYVQEASSMSIAAVIESVRSLLPERPLCLDLCAAPGGKSTLLMSHIDGLVWANEYVRSRAWILCENVAKWGTGNAIVSNMSPEQIGRAGVQCDLMLIDAPCSGEGMFRKDDVAVSEWSAENAQMCAERQRQILTDVWPALADGGILIYSTCTYNPEENERNAEWIVETLGATAIDTNLTRFEGITAVDFAGGKGFAFYPHKVRGEGFFVCALQKNGSRETTIKSKVSKAKIVTTKECNDMLRRGYQAMAYEDRIFALQSGYEDCVNDISSRLDLMQIGTPIAQKMVKRGQTEYIPSAESAMSLCIDKGAYRAVGLTKDDALKFLHGDTNISLPTDVPTGWIMVCYDGLGLGYVKNVGRRVNNYYPREWRIKMSV